ncbi:energy-coupling factor transporter transmembrane component T family protein [Levilactobacillus bambusae]|uniref:ABC transporter permease n=1 Tax=Levilactobacillus bambusae TaxID=2024736 RepID=A0A2V1N005_9LACO|nr:energy-coupling factor transporter transmembrane component T [Levilactobacillus bambusae]PWG00078.1 ABC transporter permease [Levilactobacillus bambusae]
MNPTVKLTLIMVLALEISFTQSITMNVILTLLGLIYLLIHRIRWQTLFYFLTIPGLFAAALVWSLLYQGTATNHFAGVIFSRMYAYVFLGGAFSLTTTPYQLAQSLEQNAHLPTKFVYGILAAVNMLPRIRREVATIRSAAQMRGVTLHFWSPVLYFKAILAALKWSENTAEAMTSHGYVEDTPRSHVITISISRCDYVTAVSLFILLQGILFLPVP